MTSKDSPEIDEDECVRSKGPISYSPVVLSENKMDCGRVWVPLKDKLETALEEGIFSDLTCIVGHGIMEEKIKCHSLLLRLHSKRFNSDFLRQNLPSQIEFPNFSPLSFKKFLVFLYTEKFEPRTEDAATLFQIASYFHVAPLLSCCSKLLREYTRIPNATFIYEITAECGEQDLRKFVGDFILRNPRDVSQTEGFLNLSLPLLKSLLECRRNASTDEISIFNAIIRWGRVRCEREHLKLTPLNLRRVLDGCIELIDYDQFTHIEFSEHVVDTEILPPEVSLQILKKLSLCSPIENQNSLTASESVPFRMNSSSSSGISVSPSTSTEKVTAIPVRYPKSFDGTRQDQYVRVKRFNHILSEYWIPGGLEKLTFLSRKPIKFLGIGLFGRSKLCMMGEPLPISASLTLCTGDELAQIASLRRLLPGTVEGVIYDFLLETSILLEGKKWYTLILDMSGGDMHPMGTEGKKKVSLRTGPKESVTFEFKNPKDVLMYFGSTRRKGQFPDLLFSPIK